MTDKPDPEEMIDVAEAAALLGVGRVHATSLLVGLDVAIPLGRSGKRSLRLYARGDVLRVARHRALLAAARANEALDRAALRRDGAGREVAEVRLSAAWGRADAAAEALALLVRSPDKAES